MFTETLLKITILVFCIGVGATLVMDLWLLLLKRLGIPTMNFGMLGRWLIRLWRRTLRLDGDIQGRDPTRRDVLVGWGLHYAVGVAFAGLLVLAKGMTWARVPTLLPALLTGIGTVLAPLFVLQPAMGAGLVSTKTATPLRNCTRTLVNHMVYGVGLYLAAEARAFVVSAGSTASTL